MPQNKTLPGYAAWTLEIARKWATSPSAVLAVWSSGHDTGRPSLVTDARPFFNQSGLNPRGEELYRDADKARLAALPHGAGNRTARSAF